MVSVLLAFAGSLVGIGSVAALYFKWRGDLAQLYVTAAAWTGMAASIVLWGLAFKPDVGVPFAVMILTLTGLGLVVRGADPAAIVAFPSVRSAAPEGPASISWPAVAARGLSSVVAAPMVSMTLGLAAWTWAPGHEATRFVWGVVVFLIGCAALQVWGLGAVRPWRALVLILLVGLAGAVSVVVGL